MSTQLALQAANARVMKDRAMTETEIIATTDTTHMKRPKNASYVTWTIIGQMKAEISLPRKMQSLKRRTDTAVTRIKAVIITEPTLQPAEANPVWSEPAKPSADHTAQRKKNYPKRMTHRK